MKKKNLSKKLILSKETISSLKTCNMRNAKGGILDEAITMPLTDFPCATYDFCN